MGSIIQSGGHRESIEWLVQGRTDICSLDSNAIRGLYGGVTPEGIRRLTALGPYPVQPFVRRPGLQPELLEAISQALLAAGERFRSFGFMGFVPCTDALFADPTEAE